MNKKNIVQIHQNLLNQKYIMLIVILMIKLEIVCHLNAVILLKYIIKIPMDGGLEDE